MLKLRLSAAVVGVLAVQACASVDNVIVAEPGVAFSLPVGKTAALGGSTSRITFREVREDSRCPANAVCIWAGDAKIEIVVTRGEGAGESKILSLSPPNNEGRLGDLFVRFVGLAPYPGTFDPNTPRPYVAELVIRRL
jgi:hypothetical protein